ncbi:hypothetical protein [Paenibacillus polymyxa]|uniref:Uncharacterized protein n=1 Tax=Paenibacillus polymyxa (strain SC2) TaxID=886882 RepID=E3EJV3_PAEPS|nr:hypothetical protein [Paenibacillus polymyxa]ADO59701.1 hypothetical protein PPSC2_26630 [Paenibacillus polymyxa SC2]WPQ59477.1 hypothetical protein SKN87_27835 [Paenibacillus polymyxa]
MIQELTIDFESGKVLRGETELMTTEELLFLIGSAVQYNNMFPIEQSQKFVADLHELAGTGFTTEQFAEMKKAMKEWQEI